MHRVSSLVGQLSSSSSTSLEANAVLAAQTFKKAPKKVCVTGAAGNIGYAIVFMIARGEMLGYDQPVELRLLDLPAMQKSLVGLEMELKDCAYPLLTKVVCTADYKTAFENVDIALLIGARPRGPGMQRKDLLSANAAIFAEQGKALNQYANRNVKICVVGNPANTNCAIAMKNAPNLPRTAFSAMTRLDQNRAQSLLASRLGVPVSQVKNVIIWGNHSKTQYPDVNSAVVLGVPSKNTLQPIRTAVNDQKWLDNEFIATVQDRGAAIIAARGKSSAASAASACVDHVRDWVLGTREGEFVSMAVPSSGEYGVPKDLIFSFPVVCKNGTYEIVKGLQIDAFSQGKLDTTIKELLEEKRDAGLA